MTCNDWRRIAERLDWFLAPENYPGQPGMCAQHTWHSLGGDRGCPPRWFAANANEAIEKIIASGHYWTPQSWSGPPPRGAVVGHRYGKNGHMCLSNGDGTIATTDPSNGKPTGIEPLDYPKRWGYDTSSGDYTVWTNEYAGVRFSVGNEEEDMPLSNEDIRRIADMVWAMKMTDPQTGDDVSMRTVVGRIRSNARQAADQTRPSEAAPAAE